MVSLFLWISAIYKTSLPEIYYYLMILFFTVFSNFFRLYYIIAITKRYCRHTFIQKKYFELKWAYIWQRSICLTVGSAPNVPSVAVRSMPVIGWGERVAVCTTWRALLATPASGSCLPERSLVLWKAGFSVEDTMIPWWTTCVELQKMVSNSFKTIPDIQVAGIACVNYVFIFATIWKQY